MAWKIRQARANSGDLVDPEDWNENIREFGNEYNGFLDRDNVGVQQIEKKHLERFAMNRIYSNHKNDEFKISGASTKYYGSLGSFNITFPTSGMLIVEFTAEFGFANSLMRGDNLNILEYETNGFIDHLGLQSVDVRIKVNNNEIARCHSVIESSIYRTVYCCGAIPVDAGQYTIETEARTYLQGQSYGDRKVKASDGTSRSVYFYRRELLITNRRR
tara:strand:+ start:5214 stop:5864 length:651 start_codon:yes stop_codon:yes gene_type:complete